MSMFGGTERWEVKLPSGKVVAKQVPYGATDGQVRRMFGGSMKKHGINVNEQAIQRPPTNEEHWRAQLGDQGAISEYDPSIRDRAANMVAGAVSPFAVDGYHSNQIGNRATSALDWSPLGNVMGMDEGASQFSRGLQSGDAAAAGLGAAAFGLSVLPGGKVARNAGEGIGKALFRDESGAIRAWHGSPHDFDKFDMGKLGTGEGAQAYGHGLYFAENKAVAGSYAGNRMAEPLDVPPEVRDRLRRALKSQGYLGFDTFGEAIGAIRSSAPDFEKVWDVSNPDEIRAALSAYDSVRWKPGERPRLYEVNINAEPEDLLDWDAPLKEQPHIADVADFFGVDTKKDILRQSDSGYYGMHPQTGGDFYSYATNHLGGRAPLTDYLKTVTPGIRYLDQGSRGAGNGTSNYVIFDDSLIDILNKY